jgi:hypothetical protein
MKRYRIFLEGVAWTRSRQHEAAAAFRKALSGQWPGKAPHTEPLQPRLRYVWTTARLEQPSHRQSRCKPTLASRGNPLAAVFGAPPRRPIRFVLAALVAVVMGLPAAADGWQRPDYFGRAGAAAPPPSPVAVGWTAPPQEGWGITRFDRPAPSAHRPFRLIPGTVAEQLGQLVAHAESPHLGYDAVIRSARVLPPARPTRMTLGGIRQWIADTPGQHHAIGRYQIIPSTLAMLQRRLGLADSTLFDRATQDRMAAALYRDAGIGDWLAGRLSAEAFMDNLARIWAGFPLGNGRSAFHGIAGNRATVTRAFFRSQIAAIASRGAGNG